MLKKALTLIVLVVLVSSPAFASAVKTKHAENDNAAFKRSAKAQFNEYDKRFREWNDKAKRQGEKFYREQKTELEKSRAKAAKDIDRLNVKGEKYGKESWIKIRNETSRALGTFGKALERAGSKLKENTAK